MNLTTSQLTKLGIALGICYGVYRIVDKPEVKTAAIAVGAVIAARQLPFTGPALNA
jgi:hypothetical protein